MRHFKTNFNRHIFSSYSANLIQSNKNFTFTRTVYWIVSYHSNAFTQSVLSIFVSNLFFSFDMHIIFGVARLNNINNINTYNKKAINSIEIAYKMNWIEYVNDAHIRNFFILFWGFSLDFLFCCFFLSKDTIWIHFRWNERKIGVHTAPAIPKLLLFAG